MSCLIRLDISVAHDVFDSLWHKALGARLSLKLRKHSLTTGSGAVVSVEVEEGRHARWVFFAGSV